MKPIQQQQLPDLQRSSQRRPGATKSYASLTNYSLHESTIPRAFSTGELKRDNENVMAMNNPTLQAFLHTLAGAAGAVIALIVVYPLDTLRTIQVTRGGNAIQILKQCAIRRTWKTLYTGLRVAIVGVLFSWGTYFFVYTLAKQRQRKRVSGNRNIQRKNKSSTLINIIVAIGAGICSTILSNPFWVANTRLKVDWTTPEQRKRGVLRLLIDIYKAEGLAGWFAGIIPSLVLVLNPAIQFALYDYLKGHILRYRQKWQFESQTYIQRKVPGVSINTGSWAIRKPIQLHSIEAFFLGLFAKLAATVLTYPYLVIKTRAQTKLFNVKDCSASFRCFIMILESEGFKGFYSGLPSKLIATILSSAIMFSVYEKLLPFSLGLAIRKKDKF